MSMNKWQTFLMTTPVACSLYTDDDVFANTESDDCVKMISYIEQIKKKAKQYCKEDENYCIINENNLRYVLYTGIAYDNKPLVRISQYQTFEPLTSVFINKLRLVYPDAQIK